MRIADALHLLRRRSFGFYFASRAINMLGNAMASVALAFAVLEISDDPKALGWVLAAHAVPMTVLLLWGGVIADRFPRNVVLQASNFSSAITQGALAALVITGLAEIWMLAALSFLHGIASGVGFPAMASIMPNLVPREDLQQANALVSLVRSGVVIVGPALSALIVVAAGAGWALAIDAATWLVSAMLLGLIALPEREHPKEHPSTFSELREGWSYVRRTEWLWAVVLGFGVLNAIHAGAWLTLGPARAKDTIGEQGWGFVLSAEAVGLLLTTLVLLRVRLRRPLLLGMVGVAGLALPIVVLGVHPHLGLLLVAAFVAGIGTEVFGMGWNLAMQENVPDEMLSRAYSYDALGSFVAIPVGQVAAGPLAAAFGFEKVLVVSGIAYVVVCGAVLLSRSVRTLERAAPELPATESSSPA